MPPIPVARVRLIGYSGPQPSPRALRFHGGRGAGAPAQGCCWRSDRESRSDRQQQRCSCGQRGPAGVTWSGYRGAPGSRWRRCTGG